MLQFKLLLRWIFNFSNKTNKKAVKHLFVVQVNGISFPFLFNSHCDDAQFFNSSIVGKFGINWYNDGILKIWEHVLRIKLKLSTKTTLHVITVHWFIGVLIYKCWYLNCLHDIIVIFWYFCIFVFRHDMQNYIFA